MNKYYVYILYSASINGFYIGQTVNVDTRLEEHLQHVDKDAYSSRADDWVVFYQLGCTTRHQALLIERHIKRMKSRKYIENLKKYPEIGGNLIEKYK